MDQDLNQSDTNLITKLFSNLTLNYTNDETSDEYVPYDQRPETYVVPIVFTVLFAIGLIGNGTIIIVFLRNKSMRTIPNTYIISLSVGDLLIITGALPFVSTIYTVESWPYGEFVCKLSEFLRDVSIGVTVFSLTVLSADRYMAIVLPLKRFTSSKHKELTLAITATIWSAASLLAFPGAYNSFVWRVPITRSKTIAVCYPFPQSLGSSYPKLIVLSKFFLLYTIPLVVITCFYLAMARHLIASSKLLSKGNTSLSHLKAIRARTKVAKTVLTFIMLFALCFFPNHVFMLWFYFYPNAMAYYNDFWHYFRIIGFILTFGNSCLNPVALYLVSGSFRVYFEKYLFSCLRCSSQVQTDFTGSNHSSFHKPPSSSRSSKSSKESNSTSFNRV